MTFGRSLLLLPLAALALGTGCGDGGEGMTATTPQRAVQSQPEASGELKHQNEAVEREYQERQQAEAPTPEEREAKQTATDFYAILGQDKAKKNPNKTTIDSASFCELMSEEAVAQTIHYAKVSSGISQQWDCEKAVDLLVLRAKRSGGFDRTQKAEVIGVNAQGDKATATIRFGKGPLTSVPLVKEDGEWKLAGTPASPSG